MSGWMSYPINQNVETLTPNTEISMGNTESTQCGYYLIIKLSDSQCIRSHRNVPIFPMSKSIRGEVARGDSAVELQMGSRLVGVLLEGG